MRRLKLRMFLFNKNLFSKDSFLKTFLKCFSKDITKLRNLFRKKFRPNNIHCNQIYLPKIPEMDQRNTKFENYEKQTFSYSNIKLKKIYSIMINNI